MCDKFQKKVMRKATVNLLSDDGISFFFLNFEDLLHFKTKFINFRVIEEC